MINYDKKIGEGILPQEIDSNYYIREKLQFYLETKLPVHLNLVRGRWANGVVKEIRDRDFILEEERLGIMLIFFKEVINLNPRVKKGESGDERHKTI